MNLNSLTNVQKAYLFGRNEGLPLCGISTQHYSEFKFSMLDVAKLTDCFNVVIARHTALRTVYENGEARVLNKCPQYQIKLQQASTQTELEAIRTSICSRSYDPTTWPLFSIQITEIEDEFILHVSFDRIFADQISMNLFWAELKDLYNFEGESVSGRSTFPDQLPTHSEAKINDTPKYPASYLNLIPYGTSMPLVRPLEDITKPGFSRYSRILSESIVQRIKRKCTAQNLSEEAVFLYAFGFAVSKFSEYSSVPIVLTEFCKSFCSVRDIPDLRDRTEVSYLPFQRRARLSVNLELGRVLKSLQRTRGEYRSDAIDLQRQLREHRSLSIETVLFPYALSMFLNDYRSYTEMNGYVGTQYEITQTPQLLIDAQVHTQGDRYLLLFDYVKNAFASKTILDCFNEFVDCLEYLSDADWSEPISLDKYDLSETHTSQPVCRSYKRLFDGFQRVCAEDSRRIAIIHDNCQYSYGDILEQSNAVHDYIEQAFCKESNNRGEKLIGVLIESGPWQIASLIGILQSGFAYAPMLATWPDERIVRVCKKCKFEIIIADNKNAPRLKALLQDVPNTKVVSDCDILSVARPDRALRCAPNVTGESLAYVIFTSGTTGAPKGVMMTHDGALNTIEAINTLIELGAEDRVVALSDYCFDLSVYDIFGTLSVGGALLLPDESEKLDFSRLSRMITEHGVTIWNSVPQHMELFASSTYGNHCLQESDLRTVLLSGDTVPVDLIWRLRDVDSGIRTIALGGATECGIWSNFYETADLASEAKFVPYGHALDGQGMHVLNAFLEPCPENVPGEIYFSGASLALGYFQDREKTDGSFLVHDGVRLYRAGDWGVVCPEGYIKFLGRRDRQVKVNGYRVELGEVDTALKAIPGIGNAISLIRSNEIHSYFTVEGSTEYLTRRMNGYAGASSAAVPDQSQILHDGQMAEFQPLDCFHPELPQRRSVRTFLSNTTESQNNNEIMQGKKDE